MTPIPADDPLRLLDDLARLVTHGGMYLSSEKQGRLLEGIERVRAALQQPAHPEPSPYYDAEGNFIHQPGCSGEEHIGLPCPGHDAKGRWPEAYVPAHPEPGIISMVGPTANGGAGLDAAPRPRSTRSDQSSGRVTAPDGRASVPPASEADAMTPDGASHRIAALRADSHDGEGLDSDVLAAAMRVVDQNDGRSPMPVAGYYEGLAIDVARQYAALSKEQGRPPEEPLRRWTGGVWTEERDRA